MKLPFFFARRYFFSAGNTSSINIISFISMYGITIGTTSLLIILSVFNGFEALVASLYNSFYPDIKITHEKGITFAEPKDKIGQLLEIDDVAYVSSVLEGNVILKYHDNQYIATIKGADPMYAEVTDLDDYIVRGSYRLIDGDLDYAVLGSGVELGLNVNVFDELASINVYAPRRQEENYKTAESAFNIGMLIPSGSYAIQQDIDTKFVIVPLRFAREMMNYTDEITALEVKLVEGANASNAIYKMEAILGSPLQVQTRYQQNEFLYKVMNTERWIVYLIGSIMLFILTFNIAGSLWMLALEKRKDMAYLRSMGANSSLIVKIFLTEGLLISMAGALVGIVYALILCGLQIKFGIVKLAGSGTFVIENYPVKLIYTDFLLILGTVLVISFIMSILPAVNAAKNLRWAKED